MLWALAATGVAHAEITRVDLKARGMDCSTCAHTVRVRLEQLEGVESVRISLETGVAEIRLQAGNAIVLERLAAVTRQNGFHPVSAVVIAHGSASRVDGGIAVQLAASKSTLVLAPDPERPEVFAALAAAVAASREFAVEVSGVVSFKDRRVGPLHLQRFTLRLSGG